MTELDYQVIENMEKYGGSFVVALADCMRRADAVNLLKLKLAFTEYYEDYLPDKWEKK